MFVSSAFYYFKKTSKAVLVLGVSLIPFPLQAQDEQNNTAPDPAGYEALIREAISWHPSIVETTFKLQQQEQVIEAAKSNYMPQINAGISNGYSRNGNRSTWSPRANVSLEQRIWDFGKVSSEVKSAEADFKGHRIQVLQSVDTIARDVALAMIEIHRGRKMLEAANEQLESVTAISNLVERRHIEGAATRSDMLQARSRVDAAASSIMQMNAELNRWQANLSSYLGRQITAEIDALPPEWLSKSCGQATINRYQTPTLLYAEAQVDKASATMSRERAETYPTISLGASAQTDINRPFEDTRTDLSVGLNVSTSVFNGGISRARIRNSAFGLSAAQAAYQSALNEAERLLAESKSQQALLDNRLSTLTLRYEKMQETRELYRLQYIEMGSRTLVDLLNSEQEFSQARFEAINSEHDLARLGVNCLYVSGELRAAFNLEGMEIEGVRL